MIRYPLDVAMDDEAMVEAWTWVVDADGLKLADCGILSRSTEENEAFASAIVAALNAKHEIGQRALATAYRPGGAL